MADLIKHDAWRTICTSINGFSNLLKEYNKPILIISFGTLTVVYFTYKYVKHIPQNSYPELPGGHWFRGHGPEFRETTCFGRTLQGLNKTLQWSGMYFRFHFLDRRIFVFNFKDFCELFLTNGSKTNGRYKGGRWHMSTKAENGILGMTGDVWKDNRKVYLNFVRLYGREKQTHVILEETKHLFEAIDSHNQSEFKPADLLHSAVGNVVATLIFGSRFEYSDPEAHTILQSIINFSAKADFLPDFFFVLSKYIPFDAVIKQRLRAIETTKAYIRKRIKERIVEGIREPPETLIEAYALECANASEKVNVDNLICVIFELFLAGTETTSTTLAWFVTCVANNFQIQDRMFDEIESVVGSCELTPNHLRDLTYCTAVQYEVQRYGCIAQNTIPHTSHDNIKLSSGPVVHKGEIVIGALYTIMRSPEHWKYPEEFNPHNFLDSEDKLKPNDHFVPYGIGPRICLGQNLADLELRVFIVELIRRYRIVTSQSVDLEKRVQNLTCAPEPLPFSFQLR